MIRFLWYGIFRINPDHLINLIMFVMEKQAKLTILTEALIVNTLDKPVIHEFMEEITNPAVANRICVMFYLVLSVESLTLFTFTHLQPPFIERLRWFRFIKGRDDITVVWIKEKDFLFFDILSDLVYDIFIRLVVYRKSPKVTFYSIEG